MSKKDTDQLSQLKVLEVGQLSSSPETILARYLRERVNEFTFIETLITRYYEPGVDFLHVSHYKGGKLEKSFKHGANWAFLLRFQPTRRGLLYILCFALILISSLRLRTRFDLYIGCNLPYPLVGLIMRKLRLVRRVLFVSEDHFLAPEDVNMDAIFVRFLRSVDKLAYNSSDAVWYQSGKMIEAKERERFIKNHRIPRLLVPIGIDSERLKNGPSGQIERTSIGYVGVVAERMGLQLAIEALTEVKRKVPDVKLKIIGSGPFEYSLRQKTKELGLEENVEFLGFIGDKDKITDILSNCAISVALYVPSPTQPIQYTDSAKAKEYMECGIPVIITKVPEIALEIEEKRAGFAVDYDKGEIAKAMIKLLTDDEVWQECKGNVRQLAIKYDYRKIYDKALTALGIKP